MSESPLISVQEAAKLIGYNEATIRYAIRAGTLAAERHGPEGPRGVYLIRLADALAFEPVKAGRPKAKTQ